MKKIISIFLVMIMLFGMASCESKNNVPDTVPDVSNENSENVSSDLNEHGSADVNEPGSVNGSSSTNSVKTVKVTIPEGYTLLRISWILEEKGLCTSDEFVDACQTADKWLDFNEFPFLKDVFGKPNVCFYLEGYIFPLTYDIPEGTDVKSIIKTFLNGTKQKFGSNLLSRISSTGYSLHEILTIASIIEKEAFSDEHRAMISSVLYNRLKANMPFQCDVCIKYCEGVIKIKYPDKFPTIKEYYNGKNKGLLAGPICNPGMASINAAINPSQSDYLYFIIGTVPPYEAHFSKTYEEHNAFWQENKDRLTGQE